MKKIAASLLVVLSVLSLAACGQNNTQTTSTTTTKTAEKVTGKTINMGILPAESAIPIILAQEKGFFKEAGTNVAIKSFASPNDRNVAVQSKQLDGTISDVMTEATFKKNGIDMKITSGILEDFKVLASPQSKITEMKGLAGKKVTLVPNFILEYIMDDFAKKTALLMKLSIFPHFLPAQRRY